MAGAVGAVRSTEEVCEAKLCGSYSVAVRDEEEDDVVDILR